METRGRGRRLWPWLVGLLALGVALFWWHPWGTSAPNATQTAAALSAQAQAVIVAPVGEDDLPVLENGLGTVTPLATVTVRTQIAGTLQTIGFKEGQMVAKGDFLAQIDPRPTEALLAQAEGALQRDQALLAQAQSDLKRYATLSHQDSISRQQLDDQKFLVAQDQGLVAADQGTVQTQKVNLAYCRIVAPVGGRVGLRQVDAGNYVQTSDTNGIVVITQLQPISVIFTLPENAVPAVMQKLAAGAPLPVTALDQANVTKLGTGVLETADNQIDPTTGTFKLRAIFPNTDNALFPQQFVNASLLLDTHEDATTVPNAAVQTGAPGAFVYVLNKNSTVSLRPVKTGLVTADVTEITDGLDGDEKVVVDGADRLRDGAAVRLPGAGGHGFHKRPTTP